MDSSSCSADSFRARRPVACPRPPEMEESRRLPRIGPRRSIRPRSCCSIHRVVATLNAMLPTTTRSNGKTKKERLAAETDNGGRAGRAAALDTGDFREPNRPKTCLEVDFPSVPVNYISSIEGSSGATRKPIYQLGKWWARRNRSEEHTSELQ